ncbi:dihydroneopterin aldolase family protein [Halorhabdus amylolytica]|uniref:dihydroneopterin aldolase family protein n=1 Tax=Halorhabdus amylolytica TaxID=2559573 RepID=UPI0010AA019A|nr:dihydroneopterin aldolase family protein [Halorhabdus amylolytica]
MAPTDAQQACFELGIKFGSLYHQFAGTPISPESAPDFAAAIESAIENQPHCRDVTVEMKTEAIRGAIDADVGYTEFTGEFADVEIVVAYEGIEATAIMEMTDGYPRMRLVSVA